MRSLFEEQILRERHGFMHFTQVHDAAHAEAASYCPTTDECALGPERYLVQVRRIKARVAVPVIASLNGTTTEGWLEYARLLQKAGADALEVNFYHLPTEPLEDGAAVERRLLDIVAVLKAVAVLLLAATSRIAAGIARRRGARAVQPLLSAGHRSRRARCGPAPAALDLIRPAAASAVARHSVANCARVDRSDARQHEPSALPRSARLRTRQLHAGFSSPGTARGKLVVRGGLGALPLSFIKNTELRWQSIATAPASGMMLPGGAMIFLVISELIPESLKGSTPTDVAWGVTLGLVGMLGFIVAIEL